LFQHLRGVSFRSLATEYDISTATAYRRCLTALKKLPHNADVSRDYCAKFCGILVVDGKYIRVKGYERKIPVLYGIDYLTHDIPTYILSQGENYQTCHTFFTSLRLLKYPLQAVVSDDNANIYQAAQSVYPKAVSQICHNHYKEGIRQNLGVRIDPTYVPFMRDIELLFAKRRSKEEFAHVAGKIFYHYKHDPRCVGVLVDIQKRLPQLTAYMYQPHIPRTTNLIESYNSHLEGRLKTIKGFESFTHADNWLNAYFLKRRLQKFTDCTKQFRSLNGTCSLEHTLRFPSTKAKFLKLLH
jgi:transposase-like protein